MTGLIYVGIIAVWAVVLVPAWLRRHDHLDPERSVDRFSRSMRTLAERPSLLGVPLPEREAGDPAEPDAAPEVFRVTRPDLAGASARFAGAASQARTRVGSGSAAMRRRVVLGILTAGLVVVGGLVAAGILLPVALAVPSALIVTFLGLARHQVRSERARRAASVPGAAPARPAPTASAAPRRVDPGTAGATWEARPTPLPSYVTAPAASEFPRVIDTATPGAWTAAAMLERAQQEKMRAERMAAAKAEAIARAKAEQAAAEARTRDEEYLAAEQAQWQARRRAVNE